MEHPLLTATTADLTIGNNPYKDIHFHKIDANDARTGLFSYNLGTTRCRATTSVSTKVILDNKLLKMRIPHAFLALQFVTAMATALTSVHLERKDKPAQAPIRYHGGRMITGPLHIHLIYVGTPDNDTVHFMNRYFEVLPKATRFWNAIQEYNPMIDVTGPLLKSHYTYTPPGNATKLDAAALVATYSAQHGGTGFGDLWMLWYAENIDPSIRNCQNDCAYHSKVNKPPYIPFMAIPNMAAGTPCSKRCYGAGPKGYGKAISHELGEALLSPTFYGWFDDHNNEIADLCNSQVYQEGEVWLQPMWSNEKMACV
ncbi:hypothetical protein SeLEV6574_g04796 [Synchytrium endobioticum]|uniref:Uncharacterized protein n=1 Tax=Synchytrium endobioticum TaxID=286115 RepID=A0A507CXJ2_9FUNG|nr:hypothetical protein SeLEV6574_g04796 [Synchytrium endobioticum]